MADSEGPSTVGELIALLRQFTPEAPVQFTSTDAPEYGWLEVGGGTWQGDYLCGEAQIDNEGVRRG